MKIKQMNFELFCNNKSFLKDMDRGSSIDVSKKKGRRITESALETVNKCFIFDFSGSSLKAKSINGNSMYGRILEHQ